MRQKLNDCISYQQMWMIYTWKYFRLCKYNVNYDVKLLIISKHNISLSDARDLKQVNLYDKFELLGFAVIVFHSNCTFNGKHICNWTSIFYYWNKCNE